MEPIQCSETSAATHRTPGKFPEDYLLQLILCLIITIINSTLIRQCKTTVQLPPLGQAVVYANRSALLQKKFAADTQMNSFAWRDDIERRNIDKILSKNSKKIKKKVGKGNG